MMSLPSALSVAVSSPQVASALGSMWLTLMRSTCAAKDAPLGSRSPKILAATDLEEH